MGLFSRFCIGRPLLLLAKEARAIAIPRCSESVGVAACDDVRRSVSIFIECNRSARDALFTARRCANLFASATSTDRELRLLKQQNKERAALTAALGE